MSNTNTAAPHLPHRKKRDVDMTSGNIFRHIISFALPLLAGNLFQQLYNMVDTWVVGNYVSNEAFSAVGTVGPITNMLIGFFLGLSAGAGTVISQNYGAGKYDDVQKAVHTAIVMTLAIAVVFTAVGILITPTMLRLIKMPENVMPEATTYLTTYFSGLLGLMIYNIGSGILRAVGDSKRPFYFLLVCAVLNTVLDLVFVLKFKMGVFGVALATIISQGVSAVLVVITLLRSKNCVQLHIKKLRIHWEFLKKIVTVGIPAAIQMMITQFSNIFAQSYINFFGDNVMSGYTAYTKVDQILFMPMQSLSLAATTFVGQNMGKNQVDRAKKGIKTALLIAVCSTALLMIPVISFAPYIVAFFNAKPEVVEYGSTLLRCISPFYVLCCVNQIYTGGMRGAGITRGPMLIMLGSFVGVRQLYLFIMSHICNELLPIAMGYPVGWFICTIGILIFFHKVNLNKNRLVSDHK